MEEAQRKMSSLKFKFTHQYSDIKTAVKTKVKTNDVTQFHSIDKKRREAKSFSKPPRYMYRSMSRPIYKGVKLTFENQH